MTQQACPVGVVASTPDMMCLDMTLAEYYNELSIGAAEPEIVRLADTLVSVASGQARLISVDPEGDPTAMGRYCSMSVAPEVQFFCCDMNMDPQVQWESNMPPGIWVGAIFCGEWSTTLSDINVQFPANGQPLLISVGQPSKFIDQPLSGKRLRMSSFLMGKGFFDHVDLDDPSDHLRGLTALMRPGIQILPLGTELALTQNLLALLDNPYRGSTGRLFIESTVMASIFSLAEHLNDAPLHHGVGQRTKLALDARKHIDKAPERFESIAALAGQLGTNETTLRREFKSTFGVTIFEYVLNCRMQAARLLVRDGHLQISEISYLIGYSSPSNFTAAYKRFYGHTPVEDRR